MISRLVAIKLKSVNWCLRNTSLATINVVMGLYNINVCVFSTQKKKARIKKMKIGVEINLCYKRKA